MKLIYCAARSTKYAPIAIAHGWQYGAQLPNKVYHPPYFVDQDWKVPKRAEYMRALAKHRPALATVLDLEYESQLDEVISWATEAAQYVSEAVIIIPKVMSIITKIPSMIAGKQVRLGYSVPTSHGGTSVPVWEFGQRPVHLLGGSPKNQLKLRAYLNVQSADGNYLNLLAGWNRVWTKTNHNAQLRDFQGFTGKDSNYKTFELSLKNFASVWMGSPALIRYAKPDELEQIIKIAKQWGKELGFVRKVSIRESIEKSEVLVALVNGFVVGFCNYHKRRDGWHTIYELAVHRDWIGGRIGAGLLAAIPRPRQLKTTTDNVRAIGFYSQYLTMTGIEAGRKRELMRFADSL